MQLSLFCSAYTLNCYKCVPGVSGTCTVEEKNCPTARYQCGSMRIVSYASTDDFVALSFVFLNKWFTRVSLREFAVFVSGGAILTQINMKSCFLPEECMEGSVNFGMSRYVIPIKCCNANLCNIQHAPGNTRFYIFFYIYVSLSFVLIYKFKFICILSSNIYDWLGLDVVCFTEPNKTIPNGKKCYYCNGQTCRATLNCEGSEDHCISKSGRAQWNDCRRCSWTNR